jgi:uncharacterized membrane protein
MSLDYPDYEELKKKSRVLGILWQIGDKGYYLGLIGVIISPLATIQYHFTSQKANLTWDRSLMVAVIMIGMFAFIYFVSAKLKYFSVKWGKRLKSKP